MAFERFILLVMKLTTILILAAFLQVSAHGYSQTISFSGKNVPLKKVFSVIKKQTGFVVFYDQSLIENSKPITITSENQPLENFLTDILKDYSLDFTIEGKTIVLSKKNIPISTTSTNSENQSTEKLTDVHGRVTDSTGAPLSGASVTVKGNRKGVTTNEKGEFILKGIDKNVTLVISYTSYINQEIKLNGIGELNVKLIRSTSQLDQVQIIAYGTTSQRYNTGDVTVVTSKDIEKQPVTNPLLALEGRVPGLFISQTTGLPGSGVIAQIRGYNSLGNGNDPFYVIDGVPYVSQLLPNYGVILGSSGAGNYGNPLSFINPSDIESISVLKDAVATSIYGSRAGNGAILITTKKGSSGQMKVDLNAQHGFGQVSRKLDLMNTPQYLQMRHEAITNDGLTPQYYDYDVDGTWDTTRYTDWQKTLIGGTAQYTNIYGSVSGGNSTTQYLFGATYNRQTTVFPGDFSDQKGAVNVSINSASSNQKFHFQLTGNYLIDDNQLPQADLTGQAMTLPPDAPPLYSKDGTINWAYDQAGGFPTWQNPIASNYNTYQNKTSNLVSNAILSYGILPGLDIKSSFGYNKLLSNDFIAKPATAIYPGYRSTYQRQSFFGNNSITSWIIEPQVSYLRAIGNGKLNMLIGTTIHKNISNGLQLQAAGFNSDQLLGDILAASNLVAQSATNAIYKYSAAFGRVNYNWSDKYILDLSIRRDGSSRFGPANQFHNFGAAGVSWLFSNEGFIKNSIPFLSFGKLRGSYGTSGNDQIGDYKFMNLYYSTYAQVPYQGQVGLTPAGLTNPYLEWELTKKLEFGAELGFVKDRILLSASYYQNRSSNQLLGYNLPYITGADLVARNFPATLQNSGWEFTLGIINIRAGDFEWSSHLNVTIPQDKLIAFPNIATSGYADIYTVGQSTGDSHLFHYLGVDPSSGIYQFADGRGGSTNRPDTIANYLTGHPAVVNTLPKFYGGFDNTFRYKGFELDIFFQFAKQTGRNYYFGSFLPAGFSEQNEPSYLLNRWQKPKDIAPYQRYNSDFSLSESLSEALVSNAAYSDASYIRLKNLSLSWQLPQAWRTKAHLQNARLFILSQNLLTITNYIGLDPESQSSTTLPPLRVVTFGFQVTL